MFDVAGPEWLPPSSPSEGASAVWALETVSMGIGVRMIFSTKWFLGGVVFWQSCCGGLLPETWGGSVSIGVCDGGVLSGVAVACSLVFGVGGFFPEVLHTSFVGVFAFGGIIDFPGRFWIFFARAFLLLLLGRSFA